MFTTLQFDNQVGRLDRLERLYSNVLTRKNEALERTITPRDPTPSAFIDLAQLNRAAHLLNICIDKVRADLWYMARTPNPYTVNAELD